MIRINLLAAQPDRTTPRRGVDPSRYVTSACGALCVIGAALMAWQTVAVRSASERLEQQMRAADQELAEVAEVAAQRSDVESRRAGLLRRVALIESLRDRRDQPIRLLDQISRALPEGVWFTELRHVETDVTIQGRATGLHGVSDLVTAMEASGAFALPVEIVDSQLESQTGEEAIRFELRAVFMD